MEKVIQNLQQWIVRFLKNRDLLFKRIEEIKEEAESIKVKYKEKEQEMFVVPDLQNLDFEKIKEGHKGIITVNNEKNLDFTVQNWEKLIQNKDLVIYFINPFSKLEKKWIIFPFTHNRVTEGKKIKEGLIALYNNVDPISIEEYKNIVK